jgi:hypothetical protein
VKENDDPMAHLLVKKRGLDVAAVRHAIRLKYLGRSIGFGKRMFKTTNERLAQDKDVVDKP